MGGRVVLGAAMRTRWHHRFDYLQLLLLAMLLGLGLMTLKSVSAVEFQRQLVWVTAGVVAYALAAILDYRLLTRVAFAMYAAGVGLLIAVHLFGHTAQGARRWLSLAGFPLEPSELAKLMLLVVLARYLAARKRLGVVAVAGACVLSALPIALILLQPDLGTALVFVALLFGLLFLAGVPKIQMAGLAGLALAAVPIAPHLLHGYQRRRLEIFLNPYSDPLGAGYNILQARIAIGAGGLFGQGWLHGSQSRLGFIPERSTDFVFATFAEQFGLLGSLILLGLFAGLILRLARSAAVAPDPFGHLIAGGVAVMIFAQVVQNVGMNLGVTPVAGIPLPFISYGGSALLTDMAALGLVQSVLMRRRPAVIADPDPFQRYLLNESGTVRMPMPSASPLRS
jgi:rod shape determining protein RodA